MQSSKPSKKKLNKADETTPLTPEISGVADGQAKPRSSTSSKKPSKKIDSIVDAGAGKTHRKLSTPVAPEISRPASTPSDAAPLVMTAAAGATFEVSLDRPEPSHVKTAELAHSYYVERGYAHGHAESDWFRAEQELKAKR